MAPFTNKDPKRLYEEFLLLHTHVLKTTLWTPKEESILLKVLENAKTALTQIKYCILH